MAQVLAKKLRLSQTLQRQKCQKKKKTEAPDKSPGKGVIIMLISSSGWLYSKHSSGGPPTIPKNEERRVRPPRC